MFTINFTMAIAIGAFFFFFHHHFFFFFLYFFFVVFSEPRKMANGAFMALGVTVTISTDAEAALECEQNERSQRREMYWVKDRLLRNLFAGNC